MNVACQCVVYLQLCAVHVLVFSDFPVVLEWYLVKGAFKVHHNTNTRIVQIFVITLYFEKEEGVDQTLFAYTRQTYTCIGFFLIIIETLQDFLLKTLLKTNHNMVVKKTIFVFHISFVSFCVCVCVFFFFFFFVFFCCCCFFVNVFFGSSWHITLTSK